MINRIERLRVLLHKHLIGRLGLTSNKEISRQLLKLLGRRVYIPTKRSLNHQNTINLLGSSKSTVTSPTIIGQQAEIVIGEFPDLNCQIIKNGIVSAYASGILQESYLLLADELIDKRGIITTDGLGLYQYEKDYCIGRSSYNRSIPNGIFIGGAGAFNWYHFMVELLPKVFLSELLDKKYDSWPLIVPFECQSIPQFKIALSLFSKKHEIVYLRRGEFMFVEKPLLQPSLHLTKMVTESLISRNVLIFFKTIGSLLKFLILIITILLIFLNLLKW